MLGWQGARWARGLTDGSLARRRPLGLGAWGLLVQLLLLLHQLEVISCGEDPIAILGRLDDLA